MAFRPLLFITFILLFILNSKGVVAKTAPEFIYKTGSDLLRTGDYRKTIDYHMKQLNIYPDDELIMNNLALAFVYTGKYKDAEKIYIKMLSLNTSNKNARAGLFNLYNNLIFSSASKKDYNLAFNYVNKGLYYLPDNSNFQAINGELFLDIKNFYSAGAAFKKSWEMDYERTSNTINLWKLRKAGESYYRLGSPYSTQWREYAESILKRNPDNKEILNITAEAYFFNNENPQKRNKLRNRAMELYKKENPNRVNVDVAFPLKGKYQIASGYFEWELDTHNGYDGYCLDLVAIDDNGCRTKPGIGLESMLSFGKKIYSTYDGLVEAVVSNNDDNEIGVQNYFTPNFIKIKHEVNGVVFYSRYFHIKKKSALVEVGQRVKEGELIAEIGNSGYSFGPHLHFGLYDTNGVSLPLNFKDINIKGKENKNNFQFRHGMFVNCKDNTSD